MKTSAKLLLTLGILMYGVAPLVADLNDSHLFHPSWTPHSRLHMAWLLATNTSIACLAFYLLWIRKDVLSAGVLSICVLGGFWIAAVTSGLYGGALTDVGGIDSKIMGIDGNAFGFGLALLCVVSGLILDRVSRSA